MKTLFILKNHPRNINLIKEFLKFKNDSEIDLILIKGENLLPPAPHDLKDNIKKLWKLHFTKRYDYENLYFKDDIKNIKNSINNFMTFDNIIDKNFIKYLNNHKFKLCFISGIQILPQNILNLLPTYTINFHLGFIPYYKGTITTFWPFYFLEPHMLGTTYHIIDAKVDTGEILHTSFPNLSGNYTLHESSCKAILNGQSEIQKIFLHCKERIQNKDAINKDSKLLIQGKNFKSNDWKPEMLFFIYEVHNDEIVKNFYKKDQLKNYSNYFINDNFKKERKQVI